MNNTTTISWILLAIAFASQKFPAGKREISEIADGINHAIPTDKELHASIKWLLQYEIIIETNRKFSLSKYGERLIDKAKSEENTIWKTWNNLETHISEILITEK